MAEHKETKTNNLACSFDCMECEHGLSDWCCVLMQEVTCICEVEGSEERVVVLGRHLGISWVKKNAVCPQQLLYILLQLLLLLDDEAGGFGGTECLKQGQTWRSHTHT